VLKRGIYVGGRHWQLGVRLSEFTQEPSRRSQRTILMKEPINRCTIHLFRR
jgi:hypothetical protein